MPYNDFHAGPKFPESQISRGPYFLETKKVRGPNEIGDHLSYSPQKVFVTYLLDTIQDFLCKLGMNPSMHLVEISIFSLNHVIVRHTKIIKDLCKAST